MMPILRRLGGVPRIHLPGVRTMAVALQKKRPVALPELLARAMYREEPQEKLPRLKRRADLKSQWAHSRNLRGSPYKMNMAAFVIRGKHVPQAALQLQFSNKQHYAPLIKRCLQKAINLSEIHQDLLPEQLRVAEVVVNKGKYRKMIKYHAKGRFGIMHQKWHNIAIKLEEIDWDFEIASAVDEEARENVLRLRRAVEQQDWNTIKQPEFRTTLMPKRRRKHLTTDAMAVLEAENNRIAEGDSSEATDAVAADDPPKN